MKLGTIGLYVLASLSICNSTTINNTAEAFCKHTIANELNKGAPRDVNTTLKYANTIKNNCAQKSNNVCKLVMENIGTAEDIANERSPIKGNSCPSFNSGCEFIRNVWGLLTENKLRQDYRCVPSTNLSQRIQTAVNCFNKNSVIN